MVRVPTYGELHRSVADLMKENKAERTEFQATVDRLEKRVDRLEQVNATLRSRLDKNSKNSSKTPSSDGFSKPASQNRSLREPSGKPQGKQAGSTGSSLLLKADTDQVLKHEPSKCGGCGSSLEHIPEVIAARRRVIDLPPIQVETVEHERIEKRCPCDTVTAGTVAHVDETGLRVASALSWVHYASTTTHTVFHVDRKCRPTGTLNGGVLQLFTGVTVH